METETLHIDLTLPQSWPELSDKELRYVYRLIASDFTADEVKTLCFFRWTGLKVCYRQDDGKFVCRHKSSRSAFGALRRKKQRFLWTATEVAELLPFLAWLDEPSKMPVCLARIGCHCPFAADFSEVPLEKFIVCNNLFQGYLATQRDSFLLQMAGVLYGHNFRRMSPSELISIFYWFAAVKEMFAQRFPNFFSATASDGNLLGGAASPSPSQIQESVNAMIRALTKGDISKEKLILSLDTHRALTELDAQAKEYREINSRLKK